MCKEKIYIYDIELELMAVTYSSLSFLVLNSWFLLALSYFYNDIEFPFSLSLGPKNFFFLLNDKAIHS